MKETITIEIRGVRSTVDVPEGWARIFDGPVFAGDKFLNLSLMEWQDVEKDDIGADAEEFLVMIRKPDSHG